MLTEDTQRDRLSHRSLGGGKVILSKNPVTKRDGAGVCRLTCLENHVELTEDANAPALVVDGLEIRLEWL